MKLPLAALVLSSTFFFDSSAFSQPLTITPTPFYYTYTQLKENLDKYIKEQMSKENVKGLSIALVDGEKIVWTAGYGLADIGKGVTATDETRYALGGVSRIFTAAEIFHLKEMGKVSLDKPLSSVIHGFSIHSRFKKTKPITLRTLLGDHSGLPGFFLKGIWVEQPETIAEFVEDLKSDYLYDPPGGHYRYSYVDYDLLGRVVELTGRKPFVEMMRRDLFAPLGMDSSAFESPVPFEDTARGYMDGKPFPPNGPHSHLRDVPAGGMMSTAKDMASFIRFLFGAEPEGDPPLNPKSLETLLTPEYPSLPLDFGHEVGNGWNFKGLSIEGAEEVLWCDGTYPGYFSQIVLLTQEKLGLVILSNSSEAGKISDDLAQRILKLALQVKKGLPANLVKKKIELGKIVGVSPETLESYSGFYSALGQVIHISPKPNEKCLETVYMNHKADLLPITQDTFVPHIMILIFPVDFPQYPLTFSSVGETGICLLGGLHFPVPFERISPVEIPEAWKAREGDYELENPDGQLEFSKISIGKKGDFMTVVLKFGMKALNLKDQEYKIAFLPLSDNDAVVPGLFYGDGGTLHAAVDEEGDTKIYYSGYWFKKKRVEGPTPSGTPVRPSLKPVVSKETPTSNFEKKVAPKTPLLTPAQPTPRPTI